MVCFCPFCGGNDIEDDGAVRFDGDTQYRCGDCKQVFTVQIIRLDDDEPDDEEE